MRASWLIFVIVFASGALSGFFFGRGQTSRPSTGDMPSRKEILDRFQREVGLDAEQRASFDRIVDANHARFVAVKLRVEPDLAVLRSDVRTQLRAVLRDQQKPLFDAYCRERDRQRDESMR
jgi:hypothetical protein